MTDEVSDATRVRCPSVCGSARVVAGFLERRAEERANTLKINWRPQGDSNPRYRRERAMS